MSGVAAIILAAGLGVALRRGAEAPGRMAAASRSCGMWRRRRWPPGSTRSSPSSAIGGRRSAPRSPGWTSSLSRTRPTPRGSPPRSRPASRPCRPAPDAAVILLGDMPHVTPAVIDGLLRGMAAPERRRRRSSRPMPAAAAIRCCWRGRSPRRSRLSPATPAPARCLRARTDVSRMCRSDDPAILQDVDTPAALDALRPEIPFSRSQER